MTRSSGFAAPSRPPSRRAPRSAGSSPREPEAVERGAREVPLRPLGEDRHLRAMSEPGSNRPSCSPSRPRPLSPVRTPTTAAVVDEQLLGRRLRQDRRPPSSARSREPSAEPRERDDAVAVVAHRRRRRDAQRARRVRKSTDSPRTAPYDGQLARASESSSSQLRAARVDHCAREQVRARRLALLEHARRARRRAAPRRRDRSASSWPSRIAAREPGRPRADDEHPDLDRARRRDRSARSIASAAAPGRRVRRTARTRHAPLRCRTSSVSFGTISCRSPTTPRSA